MATLAMGRAYSDHEAMELAIAQGWRGRGRVSPNPLVGCVILDSKNKLLSVGYHRQLGLDHAEVDAIKSLQDPDKLKGARVFVTLEPCSHQGRTPSCAHFLAKFPLGEVIFGTRDPHEVAKGGKEVLQRAGVKTTLFSGDLKEELEQLNEIFFYNVKNRSPFVAVKMASTLDGKVAVRATGESQWITGRGSREHSHQLRATYDGILIGLETLRRDNPSLTVRHPDYEGLENKVVVLSPDGEVDRWLASSKLKNLHKVESIYWACPQGVEIKNSTGVQLIECKTVESGLCDLGDLKEKLFSRGIYSLMVEGGASVQSQFLQGEGLAQRVHLYMAPSILGGAGLGWSDGVLRESLKEMIQFKGGRWSCLGDDFYFTSRFSS